MKRVISSALLLLLLLSGCAVQEDAPEVVPVDNGRLEAVTTATTLPPLVFETTAPAESPLPQVADGRLTVADVGSYSGMNPENGADEAVTGVAALLVVNTSDQTCQFCTLEYAVGGAAAVFQLSELPAGKAVWVLEATGMTMAEDAECVYVSDTAVFREAEDAGLADVTAVGGNGTLTVTNNGAEDYDRLAVYYKLTYGENTYLGGIAYRVTVEALKAGESRTLTAGHFYEGAAEVVGIYADGF